MLPKDVHMLVSYLNAKLRDDDMSLQHIIEIQDGNVREVLSYMDQNGYRYNQTVNQIRHKS